MDQGRRGVKRLTKLGYGTGHIMNDMIAYLGYTYALLFYMNVIKIGRLYAGIIVLVGQIIDGISTVAVGILSSRETNFGFCIRYGKQKVGLFSDRYLVFEFFQCLLEKVQESIFIVRLWHLSYL